MGETHKFYITIKHNIHRDDRRLLKYKEKLSILEEKRSKSKIHYVEEHYNRQILHICIKMASIKARIKMLENIMIECKESFKNKEKNDKEDK